MELRLTETHFQGRILKTWQVSGLSLVEAVYEPKLEVPRHEHQQANFCIALRGSCTERFGEKTREYKPFTLDFLPPGCPHSLNFQAVELRYFSMNIAPQWLERAREYSLLVDRSIHCHGGLLGELFMRVYKEFTWMDEASPLAVEGLALEMLAEVSRRQAKARERRSARWLEQARDLLHARFSEPPSLVGIAAAVSVHPIHLAREFRKQFHCTIGEYVRRLRVEYACAELASSETALADIAAAAGFSDQSHFSRTFKHLIGMTPAQYRKISRTR